MRIDRTRLRADVRRLEQELRALKQLIRTTPPPWPEPYARALRARKAEATLLYAILAHRRGRQHLRRCTRSHAHLGLPVLEVVSFEEQAGFIGDRWIRYAVGEAA